MGWCNGWGIYWVAPGNVVDFFWAWSECNIGELDNRIWIMAFFSIYGSVGTVLFLKGNSGMRIIVWR